jgi:hypothetical protein
MIFRQANGSLLEINKLSFTTDKLYYNKIVILKNALFFPKVGEGDKVNDKEIKKIQRSSYSRDCIQQLLL